MSLEPCPFCGKPFKRLKSHLPHCKMSPTAKTSKTNNIRKEILTTTSKQISHTDKREVFNKKENQKSFQDNVKAQTKAKSQMKSKTDKQFQSFQSDSVNVLGNRDKIESTLGMNTDATNPKNKWLAKREKEKVKQVTVFTQKGTKLNSDLQENVYRNIYGRSRSLGMPHQERYIAKEPKGGTTSNINSSDSDILQDASLIADSQTKNCIQNNKLNSNAIKQTQSIPEPRSNQFYLFEGENHKIDFSLYQSKTCVWDHIKDGLYVRRSSGVPVKSHPTKKSEDASATLTVEPHAKIYQNAFLKTPSTSLLTICQSSVQWPSEDTVKSKLHSTNNVTWSSDTAPSYGGSGVSPTLRDFSSENVLYEKCQGPVSIQRLGDVQLCNLSTWLSSRTPKTPSEVMTMLNKGWRWYYRKYINVQKGGVGGITMLIAGYCVLSYIWSYPHLKKERWRKYH